MIATGSKNLTWKKNLRKVADNPDWIFQEMEGMRKELATHNNPDMSYLKEKYRHIGEWLNEIARFGRG